LHLISPSFLAVESYGPVALCIFCIGTIAAWLAGGGLVTSLLGPGAAAPSSFIGGKKLCAAAKILMCHKPT
jgi:hypothetical protein